MPKSLPGSVPPSVPKTPGGVVTVSRGKGNRPDISQFSVSVSAIAAHQDPTALPLLSSLCSRFCGRKRIDRSHHDRGWDPRPTSGLVRHWRNLISGSFVFGERQMRYSFGGYLKIPVLKDMNQWQGNPEVWVHACKLRGPCSWEPMHGE